MNETLTVVGGIVVPLLTALFGYWFSRKQTRALARKEELENTVKEIEIYKTLIQDLKTELLSQSGQNKDLVERLRISQESIDKLQKTIEEVKKQNTKLLGEFKELEKQNKTLQDSYNELLSSLNK